MSQLTDKRGILLAANDNIQQQLGAVNRNHPSRKKLLKALHQTEADLRAVNEEIKEENKAKFRGFIEGVKQKYPGMKNGTIYELYQTCEGNLELV
jgi:hypothetical protein